jgi:hypothetical protein
MRKTLCELIVVATGLALVLASGFMLATSYEGRTCHHIMRLHNRNSISSLTFSIPQQRIGQGQSKTP